MRGDASIGKKQKGARQLYAAHLQRTVVEIVLQHRGDIVMEITEGFHQPGYRGIARRMVELRAGNHRVIGDIAHPAQTTNDFQHSLARRAKATLQHIADHQRPGINKRVARFALFNFQLQQRVERLAGGIFTHPLPDLLFLIVVHRDHQAQDFRDRLDREALVRVAGAVVLTVDRTDSHAELIAADAGQRRNIVRHFTATN